MSNHQGVVPGQLTYKNLSKKQRAGIIGEHINHLMTEKLLAYLRDNRTNRTRRFMDTWDGMKSGKQPLNPPALVEMIEGLNTEMQFRIK